MSQTDQERLKNAICRHWSYPPGEKAQRYGHESAAPDGDKSSERRNRTFNELGAIKLACLWALDRFKRA